MSRNGRSGENTIFGVKSKNPQDDSPNESSYQFGYQAKGRSRNRVEG